MSATKAGKALVSSAVPADGPDQRLRSRSAPRPHEMPHKPTCIIRAIVRTLIALLLLWAGLSKLGDPVSTYTALLAYQLPAPAVLLKLVAVVLPWLELLCGLMLVANFQRRLATLVASVLFGIFLVMVGQAVVRGLDISCGCFNLAILGIDEASAFARFFDSIRFAFFRNLTLLGCALFLLRPDRMESPTRVSAQVGK